MSNTELSREDARILETIERYFREAPLMCIDEGTIEMHRIIVAHQLRDRHPI